VAQASGDAEATMSDVLLTYAAQLDGEPECRCPCGHRWDQHVAHAGCMAMANDWTETAFCACQQEPADDTAAARAPEEEGE
jgi:hypothetical protein